MLYVSSADLPGVPRLDPANAVRWLAAGLDYANMMLIGRWWSHRNPNAWIYAMHQFIALLVGNELARTYLTGLPYVPSSFLQLHKAVPHFRSQIRACTTSARVTPARVTPHRLAMALVDAKFYGARPPLLNPYRTNETRWQRVMPAKKARRIRALIKKDRYVADWCARWRSLMVTCPRADYVFFKAPGDDDLAARVWRALYL